MFQLIALLCLATTVLGNSLLSVPRADGRIVGGTVAKIEDFPYQLSLHIGGFFECGAVIISPLWALTAAQCAGGTIANMELRAGSANRTDASKKYMVAQKVVHLNYNSTTSDYDIALLRVNTPFEIGTLISPIALPNSTFNALANQIATVSGWGVTAAGGLQSEILRSVEVPIVDNATCTNLFGGTFVNNRKICAGNLATGGLDACQGDAGGPLVHNPTPDTKVLVGLVSWGRGCALVNSPHVYTRLSEFRNWILTNTGV